MTEETITAAEANRSFSRLLRGVRRGHRYLVTSHGRPVARLVPAEEDEERERAFREAAFAALMDRLESQPAVDIGPWTRDELYER
jgi:prevent-host-death family protein